MDLTEGEGIKKRWQEYTEELYKKDLHDPDNHDGVITHLEPDILECDVKWALALPGTLPLQGFCTCFFLCLKCFSASVYVDCLLITIPS